MDNVHFISGSAPLCGRPDALWCTILREAVTCPGCLDRLRADEATGARTPAGAREAADTTISPHGR
ncbi:MAG: hypothetical protein U0229_02780 [Anaeromyxobacter sp.]